MPTIERSDDLAMVGINGGAWTVDLGAATPSAPAGFSALTAPWMPAGMISEDGLTYAIDEDSEEFKAWGQTSPFRKVVTGSVRTFQMTLWETGRPIVKSLMYRIPILDLEPDEDGISTFAESASPTPDRRAWIFDVYDGESMLRMFAPEAEVSERGDVAYKGDEVTGYEVTVSVYPDAAGNLLYHTYKVDLSGIGGGGS
ncbi:phage tail tube protein [Spirillospora sp. NBC_01491]|uniref:phage tail tube protein n=1 Tax=Spirillospora sp. NBC_01491 TaxID=2976007 RepID=UPI002E376BCA|nr:hypothetical protein [Spirillospora sp. NBC_01491]